LIAFTPLLLKQLHPDIARRARVCEQQPLEEKGNTRGAKPESDYLPGVDATRLCT
jgi:hypothetical protein